MHRRHEVEGHDDLDHVAENHADLCANGSQSHTPPHCSTSLCLCPTLFEAERPRFLEPSSFLAAPPSVAASLRASPPPPPPVLLVLVSSTPPLAPVCLTLALQAWASNQTSKPGGRRISWVPLPTPKCFRCRAAFSGSTCTRPRISHRAGGVRCQSHP